MKTFENIASLKLATLKEGQFVETGGHYSKGDGGGARYLIVTPQAADEFGDHTLANGNVAVLQVNTSITVKQYGAVGDGVVDDAPSINAMVQAGLPVRLNGNHKISESIVLPSNSQLIATNPGTDRITRDTSVTPFDLVVGVSVTDVVVDGIVFDGVNKEVVTVAGNRYSAIRFWDDETGIPCERVKVKNSSFYKMTSAEIQPEGTRGVITIENCQVVLVENCGFYDNRATCIFWYNGSGATDNIIVTDCYCLGEQLPYDPFGHLGSFTSGRASGVSVSNCRIEDTGYTSMNVSGVGVSVSGCVIRNPSYSGITISETVDTEDVTISGCTVESPGLDGISVFNVKNVAITGCTFRDVTTSARAGIQLIESSTGNVPENVIVSGCSFTDGTRAGLRARAGKNITITGNLFFSNSTAVQFANDSAQPLSALISGNIFTDQNNYGLELENTAVTDQSAYVANNTFISSGIATTQNKAIISNGALSTITLGENVFSNNYDTTRVYTNFQSDAAFLALGGGIIDEAKVVVGLPV